MSPTLPLYQCFKQVRAAEIVGVDISMRRIKVATSPAAGNEASFDVLHTIMVEDSWLEKFTPKPGDWLVEYADGYRSVSPAAAFTGGYTPIAEDDADESWRPLTDEEADASRAPQRAGWDDPTGTSSDVKAPDAKDAGGGVSTETVG